MNKYEGNNFSPQITYNLSPTFYKTEHVISTTITNICKDSLKLSTQTSTEKTKTPLVTLYSTESCYKGHSVFAQHSTSYKNPVKHLQIFGFNDVLLTLNNNEKVVVSPCFIKCTKMKAEKLAIYLRQTHVLVTGLSDGSYQVTINPNLLGGGPKREIHTAAIRQDVALMKSVLTKKVPSRYPIDIVDDEGTTALHYCCLNGNVEMVNMLLAKGADIEKPLEASTGNQPIHMACFNGHLEVVKIIFEKKGSSALKSQNKDGITPLRFAAGWGHIDIVTFLLSKGVEIDVIDNDCYTPLACACLAGNKGIINLLVKYGADPEKILPSVYNELSDDIKHILGGFKRQTYTSSSSSNNTTNTTTTTRSNSAMNAMGTAFGKELASDIFKLALNNNGSPF